MQVYLNRGLIPEQAVVALIRDYLDTLQVNKIYENNQVHVAPSNIFAKLYMENGDKAADHFPAIVVSCLDDDKDRDLNSLRPQKAAWIGYEKPDIEAMLDIYKPELVNGKKVKIPGICAVTSDEAVAAIFARLEKKEYVYGFSLRAYRRETISVDVWCENVQLKNELYEQVRLFVLGDMRNKLTEKYKFFDPRLDDDTVRGQRVLPFLIDYGLTLAGANVQFEVTYAVEQNFLDTDWDDIHREIIIGGTSHV